MTAPRLDIEDVRSALSDPRRLVEQLGLSDGAKRQAGDGVHVRCPWHAETSASCSVTRGSDGTVRVRCFGCGQSGDALHLVAAVHNLDPARDFGRILELAADLAGVRPGSAPLPARRVAASPPPRDYPPIAEVEALWSACLRVDRTIVDPDVLDLAVCFHLAGRGWFPPLVAALDVVRVTPLPSSYAWPKWWPSSWGESYRLVARAYDATGTARSIHARSIVPSEKPKVRCPTGHTFDLVLADALGLAMLRGEAAPEKIAVVEGLADSVAMALEIADAGANVAVIGITTGSGPTMQKIAWPEGVPVVVLTHDDTAGNAMALQVRRAVPKRVEVLRGDMSYLTGVADERETDGRTR
jgi:hypothetical protein